MSADLPVSAHPRGLRLAVRLTPRAGRNAVQGVTEEPDGRRVARLQIAAPPVEGEANAALVAFVARSLGLPRRHVSILSGETGRTKLLLLEGEADLLSRKVADWLGA